MCAHLSADAHSCDILSIRDYLRGLGNCKHQSYAALMCLLSEKIELHTYDGHSSKTFQIFSGGVTDHVDKAGLRQKAYF